MVRRKTADFVCTLLICMILPFVTDAKPAPTAPHPLEILIASPDSMPPAPKGKDQNRTPYFAPWVFL